MHKAGKINDPLPRTLDQSMYADLFSDATPDLIGMNSRSRAIRLRRLGWKPTEKDWKRSFVEDEMPCILNEEMAGFDGYRLAGGDRLIAVTE